MGSTLSTMWGGGEGDEAHAALADRLFDLINVSWAPRGHSGWPRRILGRPRGRSGRSQRSPRRRGGSCLNRSGG